MVGIHTFTFPNGRIVLGTKTARLATLKAMKLIEGTFHRNFKQVPQTGHQFWKQYKFGQNTAKASREFLLEKIEKEDIVVIENTILELA